MGSLRWLGSTSKSWRDRRLWVTCHLINPMIYNICNHQQEWSDIRQSNQPRSIVAVCLDMWKSKEIRFNQWGWHIQVPSDLKQLEWNWPLRTILRPNSPLPAFDALKRSFSHKIPIFTVKLAPRQRLWGRKSSKGGHQGIKNLLLVGEKLGMRTSNPSPFSHLDSSPAIGWWFATWKKEWSRNPSWSQHQRNDIVVNDIQW